jgi:hypothetical protein
MPIGAALFVIAVGAILKFATNLHVAHVNIDTVGVILMITGGLGLILGLYLEFMRWRGRNQVRIEEPREPPPRY